jgi:hypothetical protein
MTSVARDDDAMDQGDNYDEYGNHQGVNNAEMPTGGGAGLETVAATEPRFVLDETWSKAYMEGRGVKFSLTNKSSVRDA